MSPRVLEKDKNSMDSLITFFTTPQMFIAGMIGALDVPTVLAFKPWPAGKKYAIPLAVVSFVWFVLSIIRSI